MPKAENLRVHPARKQSSQKAGTFLPGTISQPGKKPDTFFS